MLPAIRCPLPAIRCLLPAVRCPTYTGCTCYVHFMLPVSFLLNLKLPSRLISRRAMPTMFNLISNQCPAAAFAPTKTHHFLTGFAEKIRKNTEKYVKIQKNTEKYRKITRFYGNFLTYFAQSLQPNPINPIFTLKTHISP